MVDARTWELINFIIAIREQEVEADLLGKRKELKNRRHRFFCRFGRRCWCEDLKRRISEAEKVVEKYKEIRKCFEEEDYAKIIEILGKLSEVTWATITCASFHSNSKENVIFLKMEWLGDFIVRLQNNGGE